MIQSFCCSCVHKTRRRDLSSAMRTLVVAARRTRSRVTDIRGRASFSMACGHCRSAATRAAHGLWTPPSWLFRVHAAYARLNPRSASSVERRFFPSAKLCSALDWFWPMSLSHSDSLAHPGRSPTPTLFEFGTGFLPPETDAPKGT
jgi:hypothetical protein